MLLPKFELVQPSTVEEACSLLTKNGGTAVLAGGTDLIIELKRRLSKPSCVVGLKNIQGLDYIDKDAAGVLRIGAMTSLQSVECSPLIAEEYPVLAQAAELVAVPPIRRAATIGGNLSLDTRCIHYNQSEFWRKARPNCFKLGGDVCHAIQGGRRCVAVYQGDLAPILIALGAQVRIVSATADRTMPLAEFFTGKGEKPNVLEAGELVTEVIVPANGAIKGSAYEKLRVREGMDFPLAGVAVALGTDGQGTITGAKVVLGAVGPAPVEVATAGTILVGKKVGDALLEEVAQAAYEVAHPAANLAMDPGYRRKMVKVLTKRAVRKALEISGAK